MNDADGKLSAMYRGLRFRSRVEATWAAFFDIVRWPWEYSSIHVGEYVPAFVLHFPQAPVLIDVMTISGDAWDLQKYVGQLEAATWAGEKLIVGAALFEGYTWSGATTIGLLLDDSAGWDEAVFESCGGCGSYSFFSATGSYHCRVNGCYDGKHFIGLEDHAINVRRWREASNAVPV